MNVRDCYQREEQKWESPAEKKERENLLGIWHPNTDKYMIPRRTKCNLDGGYKNTNANKQAPASIKTQRKGKKQLHPMIEKKSDGNERRRI